MHINTIANSKDHDPKVAAVVDMHTQFTSWVEIDRSGLLQNIAKIKQFIGNSQFGVIIKANAYGHGITQIAQVLQQSEYIDWAIAFSLSEAIQARAAGFKKKILVCGFADGKIEDAILNEIDLVVHDRASLLRYQQTALQFGAPIAVHLKVDTGLNRLGFTPSEALEVCLELKNSKQILLRGIFSHFSESEAADNWYATKQLDLFNELLTNLINLNINIPIVHLANTVAIFRLADSCKSLVRVGGGVYGLRKTIQPALIANDYFDLEPVITWKSKVIQVRTVPAGSFISYGRTFMAPTEMKIATIPVGYADGYGRELSNNSVMYINGILAPVVGKVCMNLTMIDVTKAKSVAVGDQVVLLGGIDGVRVTDLMQRLNTIACDVTTSINWTICRVLV
jgi:alanine racemase